MLSKDNQEYLCEVLERENERLEGLKAENPINCDEIVHCLNSVIECKHLIDHSGKDSIYIDLKEFIRYYIMAADMKESGYDLIDVNMVDTKLNKLNVSEKSTLLKQFKRELSKHEYIEKAEECDLFIDRNRMKYYLENKSSLNILKYFGLLSASSFPNLILTILILIVVTNIVFLPAPFRFMETIKVDTLDLSDISLMNHLANTLSILFDLDNKMEVVPINLLGVLLLGFLKLLFVTIIINYFWKRVIKHIKRL